MKTVAWMMTLMGAIAAGFTAWALNLPHLHYVPTLPHFTIPITELTAAACFLGCWAVLTMLIGWRVLGGIFAIASSLVGVFGADQLWATAGSLLFIGAILAIYSERPLVTVPPGPVGSRDATQEDATPE